MTTALQDRVRAEARQWLDANPNPTGEGPLGQIATVRARVERDNTGESGRSSADVVADGEILAQVRDDAYRRYQDTLEASTGRSLLASEQRTLDSAQAVVEAAAEAIRRNDLCRVDRSGLVAHPGEPSAPDMRKDAPLSGEQRLADWVERFRPDAADQRDLDLGKVVRGMTTGRWDGAEAEYRAMGITPGSSGGFVVPERLSAQVLDLARAQTRVLQAGAQTFPLSTDTTHVAKLTGDAQATWRGEHAPIGEDDLIFDRVTFKPAALAVIVRVSRELLEDGQNVEQAVRNAIARSIAVEIDRVALRGSGVGDEPTGVLNTTGVTTTELGGGDGATPTWDDLVDAAGRVEDANYTATAQIMAPRTVRALGKQKDVNSQYLRPPSVLDGVARLPTTQIPTNQTTGLSTDTSELYTGGWEQLFIGLRTRLQINALTERYADVGQVGFMAWYRGDVQVARADAFDVLTGVRG